MPANQAAAAHTDRYRISLGQLRAQTEQAIARAWGIVDLDNTDATYRDFTALSATVVEGAQRAAGALTERYLTAYLTASYGRHTAAHVDPAAHVGEDPFGRPLPRAFLPPLLTVRRMITRGHDVALRAGQSRAMRIAGESIAEGARITLGDAIELDNRFIGWRRVIAGTCGACMAAADNASAPAGTPLRRHPNCRCVAEGNLRGVIDRFIRPTGVALVAGMTLEQLQENFGAEKGELLFNGELSLDDLSQSHEMALGGTVITETPLSAINS